MDQSQSLLGQQKLQRAFQNYHSVDIKKAEAEYISVISDHPEIPEAHQYLAIALMDQNKSNKAIEILESALEKWPENPHLLTTITSALSSSSQMVRALKYAEKTAQLFPQEVDVQYNHAGLLMANGKQDEAIDAYQEALRLNPNLALAHYNMGCIKYGQGDKSTACEAFKKAVNIDQSLMVAHNNLGQVYNELGDYQNASIHLKKVLEKDPNNTSANMQSGMAQHAIGDVEKALTYFLKAAEGSEPDAELCTLTGNAYRDVGNYEKAIHCYQEALKKNKDNEIAQKNLRKLEGGKLAGWHAAMLADGKRNQAYDQAIRKAVSADTKVLDIGAGSGLLSMMAARAGASKVTACEMTPLMSKIAKQVVADNGYKDKIRILNEKSNNMEVGTHLDEKADLIISEILDMGLVGEGVVPAMRHAKEHLLVPGGKMIPKGGDVYGILIETKYIHQIHPLNELEGFNLSGMKDYLNLSGYSRIFLEREPHTKLSDVFPVLNYDFMNTGPIISGLNPSRIPLRIKAVESGNIRGVAFWFDLHLDDEITMSSGPHKEMIHWGQAMYYFQDPIEVKRGEEICIEVVYDDTSISFEPIGNT